MNAPNQESPSLGITLQYIQDFSFENPNPLEFLNKENPSFETELNVNVKPESIGEALYSVVLKIGVKVLYEKKTVYLVDLDYVGVFDIRNAKDDFLKFLLFIECPRLLFPFSREIIARATQDSGFPSLVLRPIDFASLVQGDIENKEMS